ncbi:MAG: hypothetical protein AAB091_06830 [Elusimicrobiota bacterium]
MSEAETSWRRGRDRFQNVPNPSVWIKDQFNFEIRRLPNRKILIIPDFLEQNVPVTASKDKRARKKKTKPAKLSAVGR